MTFTPDMKKYFSNNFTALSQEKVYKRGQPRKSIGMLYSTPFFHLLSFKQGMRVRVFDTLDDVESYMAKFDLELRLKADCPF